MSQGTLEERLDRLEKVVEGVVKQLSNVTSKQRDWRRTVGMFDGDPVMGEIIDDALRPATRSGSVSMKNMIRTTHDRPGHRPHLRTAARIARRGGTSPADLAGRGRRSDNRCHV